MISSVEAVLLLPFYWRSHKCHIPQCITVCTYRPKFLNSFPIDQISHSEVLSDFSVDLYSLDSSLYYSWCTVNPGYNIVIYTSALFVNRSLRLFTSQDGCWSRRYNKNFKAVKPTDTCNGVFVKKVIPLFLLYFCSFSLLGSL